MPCLHQRFSNSWGSCTIITINEYKYAPTIVTDDSRVMFQIVASLSDDSSGIIYNHNIFIGQATGLLILAGKARSLTISVKSCKGPPLGRLRRCLKILNWGHNNDILFSSQHADEPKNLVCYITLAYKGSPVTNTLAY